MEYLLKVTAVVTIFYTIYKLFLQRDTFFESNRWFLIIGLISSLVIPFLVIPIYIQYTPTFYNVTINGQIVTETIEKPFNIIDYLQFIYCSGVVFFLVSFFIQLSSLIKIIYKNRGIRKDGFVFIETQSNTSPFSFFKWIVYNPETFNQTELEHIIEHEKTHARQYHSIDILITQLFCVLLWFNPFMWLYIKDLKQNLEFIADKRTLNQYNCKKSYQYTLLKTSMPSHQMALSNHFYNSLIKKRIVMLHKSKSKKINQLKYALVIPIVALFLMGFNTEEIYINKNLGTSNSNENDTIMSGTVTDYEGKPIHKATIFNGYSLGVMTDAKGNYKIKAKKGDELIFSYEGMESQKITIANEASINVKLNKKNTIIIGFEGNNSEDKQPLYLLDSKEVSHDVLRSIDQNNIESIDVLKSENAKSLYGEKGKDGVILITSKDKTKTFEGKSINEVKVIGFAGKPDSTTTIRIGHKLDVGKDKHPFVIVDGEESPQEEFEKLNPDKIESMTVLKDETATKKYGKKGENGVIEITTKK